MSNEMVVVVAGGEAPEPDAAHAVPPDVPVVAADQGLDHARALGLRVTVAVGDFDSASADAIASAEREGTPIERHPEAKDATDLELALDAALALEPERILVLAGVGGRLDHLLSVLLLLGAERYAQVALDARVGPAQVHVIRRKRSLDGMPGELISLFAVGGRAEGVRTEGLVYPLASETLEEGSSRGVSNQFDTVTAVIRVDTGTVLAVRPGVAA